jgi:photosystem II stability/assembly factor-like uncharacterized protein
MFENRILMPKPSLSLILFDRHVFDLGEGAILAVTYGVPRQSNCNLLKSTDGGATWKHFSTIGSGYEPSVARLSPSEFTAVIRQSSLKGFHQFWSHDGGKTWTKPTVLEEGSVDPDLVVMSNGVLACSYGRPGIGLMLSTDGGKTWGDHRVITHQLGFNYGTIQEVQPGRLLYIHDAPPIQALYIDVQRADRQ